MARKPRKTKVNLDDDSKVAAAKAKLSGDFNDLVTKYIKLRDKKQAIEDEVKDKKAKIDSVLEKIEGIILASMEELGLESVATESGTAYKSTRTSATVADWDTVFDYIRSTESWHMLERRVNKSAVVEHKNETGELPPGVGWREEVTVNVRRKS